MSSTSIRIALLLGLALTFQVNQVQAKPIKVFILAGQSNMEGHAHTNTFAAVAKDPKTAGLYNEMVDAEGKPLVCENVWISHAYGNQRGDPVGTKSGKLSVGWGARNSPVKIGPEYTFGITMSKSLGEPVLLIKNAWGGKSLQGDFRPPSGEPLPETASQADKENAGKYYKLMIEHVKTVLADPGKVCPAYDPKEGVELAGFVWFQGFNDLVSKQYLRVYPEAGKKGPTRDYSEYSRLFACLIRDLRKEFSAPDMPFVVGVLGVDGKAPNPNTVAFRNAMAAPAEMPEFKETGANVFTEKFWPYELAPVAAKADKYGKERNSQWKKRSKDVTGAERGELWAELTAKQRAKMEKELTEDELFLIDKGISNRGFHYYGSAKFFGQIGKAFAEALIKLNKGQ